MNQPETTAVAEARKRVLEDAQNYPGFTRLVDALVAAVRAEERESPQDAQEPRRIGTFEEVEPGVFYGAPFATFVPDDAPTQDAFWSGAQQRFVAVYEGVSPHGKWIPVSRDSVAFAGQAYENPQPSLVQDESPTQDALADAPTIEAEANP